MSQGADQTPWPPPSLCTVIVPASAKVFHSYASITISAPASLVFAVLLDTSGYPRWNTWCPNITVRSQPDDPPSTNSDSSQVLQRDTRFTLHIIMDPSRPSSVRDTLLRVTDISTPEKPSDYVSGSLLEDPSFTSDMSRVYRVAWATDGGFMAGGLRTERFHEVIILAEDQCEVRTWECFEGLLAWTVKWLYGETLMKKFAGWVRDLKCESERKYGAEMEGRRGG